MKVYLINKFLVAFIQKSHGDVPDLWYDNWNLLTGRAIK